MNVAGGQDDDGMDLGESLFRLSRDLKQASRGMTRRDARWLVDFYYTIQDERIRSAAQMRTSKEETEPHKLIEWVFGSMNRFENAIRGALGEYAKTYKVGQWLQSIVGIGPVLSAAVLTNFDIRKARTVGHFYRYAGLDPTSKWPSTIEAGKAIDEAVEAVKAEQFTPASAVADFYAINMPGEPFTDEDVAAAAKLIEKHGVQIVRAVVPTWARWRNGKGMKGTFSQAAVGFDDAVAFFRELCQSRGIGTPETSETIPFAAIRMLCDKFGRNVFELLKLVGMENPTRTKLATALSKRPFNARLKSICAFKAGECFVKTQNHSKSVYGKLYAHKKAILVAANEAGEFKSVAEAELAAKPNMKGTQRFGHWKNGKIAPAHCHDRARRWAVQIFLSHTHHVMYLDYYGEQPPKPYIFEHPELGDHRHFIEPPSFDGFEGRSLKEMLANEPMNYTPMKKALRSEEDASNEIE